MRDKWVKPHQSIRGSFMTGTGSAYSVLEPTRQAFLRDLESGAYRPGERLPGERELARRYGVGRSSMVKVLHRLEKERYVERVPVYGTFIRQDLSSRVEPVHLVVVSGDRLLAGAATTPFSWESSSEILRGMISESTRHNGLSLSWKSFPEPRTPLELRRQSEELEDADGVIFNGSGMEQIKEAVLRTKKAAVVLGPKLHYRREMFPVIDYDRWGIFPGYCEKLLRRFPGRPVILLGHEVAPADVEELRRFDSLMTAGFEAAGVQVSRLVFAHSTDASFEEQCAAVAAREKELRLAEEPLLVAMNRALLPPLCAFLRKKSGGAALAGLVAGCSIGQFHAEIPRWQEPFFDMAGCAVAMLTDHLRGKGKLEDRIFPMVYHDN